MRTVPTEAPGTQTHVAKVLADAKVNVFALLASAAGSQGSAQVVVAYGIGGRRSRAQANSLAIDVPHT